MTTSCKIEERIDRAAARWGRAIDFVHQGAITVQRSRWRITSSRAVLDWGRRPISGGGHAPYDDPAVRGRLQALITAGLLPHRFSGRLLAGPCQKPHDCTLCGLSIDVGEIEYEIPLKGVVIFLHRACFSFWQHAA